MGAIQTQEFFIEVEAKDEQQMLAEYEGQVLKESTYKVKGKTAISYQGIKHLVNKLGFIKVLSVDAEFIEKPEEMWVATVVAINEKYGTQLPGAGEQPYMRNGEPDPFARRVAISKATRNALRAVIPEAMIIKFLEDTPTAPKKPRKSTPRKVEAEVNPFNQGDKKNQIAEALSRAKLDAMRLSIHEQDGTLTITPDPDLAEEQWKRYHNVFTRYEATWNEQSWEVNL